MLDNSTFGKTLKTAAWIAVSAVVAYLATLIAGDPELFGSYTLIANLVLVGLAELSRQARQGQTIKVAAWIAVSAVVAYFGTLVEGSPELFGQWTLVANIALVAAKNAVDPKVSNLPS